MSTTQRVQCCFRCCVLHWLGALGLDENARHWHRIAKSFTVSSGTGAIEASEARAPALGATPQFTSPPPLESVLFFRFSMARFAHVQAVSLADWKALPGADAATLRGARFSTPSAARARNALVVLNGYGHILGSRRAAVLNISRAAVAGADADDGAIVHATAPPDHERVIFADPLPRLVRDVLPAGGAHAFLYGGDKSIERALLEKYASELGSGLKRFLAPNLAPAAARLPYATAVPLGLNRNARHLLQPHSHTSRADAPGRAATLPRTSSLAGGLLDEHTGALGQRQARRHGRRAQLLCCCMRTYEHRLAVASALNRSGFDCGQLSRGSLGSWEATMEQYARHRLVVAIHGRGNQDLHVRRDAHPGRQERRKPRPFALALRDQ